MDFTAVFEPDGEGWLVTFPALPEAITGGHTRAEAGFNAVDALEIVLLTYAKDGRSIPTDRAISGDTAKVSPSAQVMAKLALIDAFRQSGLTRVALADRLGKRETEVRRMLDPYYGTKLPAMEEAMHALGKRFVITVKPIERAA